ncbi:MAG: plasmid mobilization protein [Faecalibacillus sp.]
MKIKRRNRIEIRLSDEELDHLNKAVLKTGLSREAYLRLIIQKIVPAEKPYPDLKETISQLRRIGNNLNQIAVIAYKTGSIDVMKYKMNFEELQKQIQHVLRVNDEYRKDEVDI